MFLRVAGWLPAVVILCAAGALYLRSLDNTPIYLAGDEAYAAIHAHSFASTGRNRNGDVLPLYIYIEDPLRGREGDARWWQPTLIYLQALALKVLPLREGTIRLPSAMLALINIVLSYGIAQRLFHRTRYAVTAALVLAMTPAHLIFARQGLDYLCPVTFVLAWLWCLATYLETGKRWSAFAAGLCLGVGFYSYIAAWAFMPLYLLLTWLAQLTSRQPFFQGAIATLAGFVLPLLLLVPWIAGHPAMMGELFAHYQPVDPHRQLTLLQSVRDALNYNNIQDKVHAYWDAFNPSFLFLTGGLNLTHATRRAGVFLIPVAVLLACGVYSLTTRRDAKSMAVVLLTGLATAPIPAVLIDSNERGAIQRALVLLPFVIIISVFGTVWLLEHPRRVLRAVGVLLLVTMPIQYASFARDYFGDYRRRAGYWFDPVNFRGVAESLLHREATSSNAAIYLSSDLDAAGPRWMFYLLENGRQDLWQRTRQFSQTSVDVSEMAPGSLLVLYANDPRLAEFVVPGKFAVDETIVHAGGSPSAVILRRLEKESRLH